MEANCSPCLHWGFLQFVLHRTANTVLKCNLDFNSLVLKIIKLLHFYKTPIIDSDKIHQWMPNYWVIGC